MVDFWITDGERLARLSWFYPGAADPTDEEEIEVGEFALGILAALDPVEVRGGSPVSDELAKVISEKRGLDGYLVDLRRRDRVRLAEGEVEVPRFHVFYGGVYFGSSSRRAVPGNPSRRRGCSTGGSMDMKTRRK